MTARPGDPILDLPELGDLVADDRHWRCPSRDCAGRRGYARLRAWRARGMGGQGIVAVATELGEGVSVTNAIADIWEVLKAAYPAELWLLEHWPASQAPDTGEHLDAVVVEGRRPRWARVWPTPPENRHHRHLEAWIAVNGAEILEGKRPGTSPARRSPGQTGRPEAQR
jgi:hypothetical protein